ncbi:MAG: hypothetical protein OHK0039_37740 [Bacteroidia bacterium]
MDLTVAYIVFGIVMLHLLAGFGWVLYRMNRKPPTGPDGGPH